mmetsp:Transcript_20496/g.33853  ORF Transcript_20496/g.33853 Transcript_20496/m.33853 type:complete len:91 (-) Transcript_20496:1841-2113(-)
MVEASSGTLLTCTDVATAQFVLFLQEQGQLGRFVQAQLDETHLFVDSDKVSKIIKAMDKFSDSNAYDLAAVNLKEQEKEKAANRRKKRNE